MKKILFTAIVMVVFSAVINAQTKKTPATPAKPATPATPAKAPVMKTLMDSFSYAIGLNVANNMKEQGISEINIPMMQKAIDDVYKNRTTLMTKETANMKLQEQLQAFQMKKKMEQKAKGAAYMEANKKKPGVKVLPNGLQYEIIKEGEPNGVKPLAADTVVVNYVGTLIDGTEFDNSLKRGEPATFPVGGVIRGWTEILQMMPKGSHWRVAIPSDLAYGDRGAGAAIPPGATLLFDIMLIEVKPAVNK